jgi:4-amino-4-deoxy-L-arabinose transferase-like glycosyltransferase
VAAEEEALGVELGREIGQGVRDVREATELGVGDDQNRERQEVRDEAPRPADDDRRHEQDEQEAVGRQREAEQYEADRQRDDERGRGRKQAAARELGYRWAPALVAAGAALLAVAARLPFLRSPLTADEGGYAEAARLWERGGVLYQDVWVDRPQGLLLAYRLVLNLGGSAVVIRAAATVVGALLVVAVLRLGMDVGGRIVGCAAALLLATVGASPFIESFTLSGELIASLVATLALVAFARYLRNPSTPWLTAAGLLAGAAPLVKQSALDAVVAIVACLLWSQRRRGLVPAGIVVAAAAVPAAAAWLAAPSREGWWSDVVAYRGRGDSVFTGSPGHRVSQFVDTLPHAALALGVLALLAAAGWRTAPFLVRAWLAAAGVGVVGGGNFHAHYYIQLAPPLAVLAGFGVQRVATGRARALAAAAAVGIVTTAAFTVPLWLESPTAQARDVWPRDPHLATDAAVAAYVRSHVGAGRPIQVLWGAADVYYLADRAPALRYMWRRPIETVPGALGELHRLLAARVPALVVLAQPATAADPGGATASILRTRYRVHARVAGVPVLAPLRG